MELIATNIAQKQGNSIMITLPNVWVKEIKVKKGDVIDIYREDDTLILMKGNEIIGDIDA